MAQISETEAFHKIYSNGKGIIESAAHGKLVGKTEEEVGTLSPSSTEDIRDFYQKSVLQNGLLNFGGTAHLHYVQSTLSNQITTCTVFFRFSTTKTSGQRLAIFNTPNLLRVTLARISNNLIIHLGSTQSGAIDSFTFPQNRPYTDGKPHTIAISYDAINGYRVWYDQLELTDVIKGASTPAANFSLLQLGRGPEGGNDAFEGQMEYFALYNSKLPDDEIISISKSNAPTNELAHPLTYYLNFQEKKGRNLVDKGGNVAVSLVNYTEEDALAGSGMWLNKNTLCPPITQALDLFTGNNRYFSINDYDNFGANNTGFTAIFRAKLEKPEPLFPPTNFLGYGDGGSNFLRFYGFGNPANGYNNLIQIMLKAGTGNSQYINTSASGLPITYSSEFTDTTHFGFSYAQDQQANVYINSQLMSSQDIPQGSSNNTSFITLGEYSNRPLFLFATENPNPSNPSTHFNGFAIEVLLFAKQLDYKEYLEVILNGNYTGKNLTVNYQFQSGSFYANGNELKIKNWARYEDQSTASADGKNVGDFIDKWDGTVENLAGVDGTTKLAEIRDNYIVSMNSLH
ncbi:MAG: LamG-like jellyroll fold domain-containing protein [Flammeovirgaceae bacterium]